MLPMRSGSRSTGSQLSAHGALTSRPLSRLPMADVQMGVSPRARIPNYSSQPPSPTRSSRPPSPSKRAQMHSIATPSDPLRPRAKVTTSVNVALARKPPSTLSPGYASGSATPRAPSPVKQQDPRQGRLSPKPSVKTLSRVRSRAALSAVSAPSSPRITSVKSQYASLSAATSDSVLSKPGLPRVRPPSISSLSQISTHSAVMNGVCSPPLSAVSFSQDSDAQSNVSTHRIKAKVSSLVKGKPSAHVPPSPSPLLMPSPAIDRTLSQAPLSPSSQFRHRLGRTASISSLSAPPTPPQVYPITTANPAANVHRYATLRSPSYTYRPPQSFSSPLQADHKPSQLEPSLVPPPPLSPPVSSASFSSQSSVSRPSLASTNRTTSPGLHLNGNSQFRGSTDSHTINGINPRTKSRSNSLVIHDIDTHPLQRIESSEPGDESSEERTLKAEAKSHRKIADLEITTKSLLAINSQLEANKHKQAKEIRDLRRKLRESQLALPPRTYRELKASGDVVETDKDDEEPEEQQVDGDEDARLTAEAIKLGKDDELFDRVRLIIESLLTSGKQALTLKVEDLTPPKGAAKVLHEVEARTWRDGGDSGTRTPAGVYAALDDSSSSSDYGDYATSRRISDNSLDCNSSTRSEREVEELIGNLRSSLSASLRA